MTLIDSLRQIDVSTLDIRMHYAHAEFIYALVDPTVYILGQ